MAVDVQVRSTLAPLDVAFVRVSAPRAAGAAVGSEQMLIAFNGFVRAHATMECGGQTRRAARVPGGMTTSDDTRPDAAPATPGSSRPDGERPVTITLSEGTLRKLKIVAIMKDTTVSDLLAEAAAALVKRDLRKVLGKLDE